MPSKRILMFVGIITISSMLAFCQVSLNNQRSAMKTADEFALNSAFDLKDIISKNSVCPAVPPNWAGSKIDHDDRVYVTKGAEGNWFRVIYECKPDLSFHVAVYYSIDSEKFFKGAAEGDITILYGHFTERKKLNVKSRSEVVSAINSIY